MRTGAEACALLLALACVTGADAAGLPQFGRPASAHALASREALVYPDGRGLPPGSGTVAEGRVVFERRCVTCHGASGRGGPGGELAGGNPDLTAPQPDRTIGTYWPDATTLFDFIRRAMPLDAPRSLTDDEVYALAAYLLDLNGIPVDGHLDAAALAAVKMPNRQGFRWIDAQPD